MKNLEYCIGEEVELIKDQLTGQPPIKSGIRFIIKSFPPCVRKIGTKFDYFLYGKTKDGIDIRAFIEEVKRV